MLLSVPAFIGFACCEVGKNELTTSPVAVMISKVRGKVSSIPFEQFHKHSAEIITAVAVFGKNTDGEINNEFVFSANNVVCNHMCK